MMPIAHFGNKTRKRLRFGKNSYKLSKYFLFADMTGAIRNYYDRLFSFHLSRFDRTCGLAFEAPSLRRAGLVAGSGLEPPAFESR